MSEIDAADAIIELIRANPPTAAIGGDTPAGVMYGAYIHAFRRFVRIRDLARAGAGTEVVILTRALLSLVARAIWVDQSTDPDVRLARFEAWQKRELDDQAKTAAGTASRTPNACPLRLRPG